MVSVESAIILTFFNIFAALTAFTPAFRQRWYAILKS